MQPSPNATSVATRTFTVAPSIIYSLIKAQAGTLAKGLLECIMNSVDAGAQAIDIVVEPGHLVVSDDGKGFETREAIEECFEVFGFEHREGERTYGQFGIGRAQLWNFCSTVWHTNQFRMDVDIKHKGLDYDLVEGVGPVRGLRIEGAFYEPLKQSDILACERELQELIAYLEVPVTFNGERLNKDASEAKWTLTTPDAWVALQSHARTLSVYNLGVKVRDYPAEQFGTGGVVVTRPGVRLALNMARNDILVAECKVWRRIRPLLQRSTDEQVKRGGRLSEAQLANLATRFLAGDAPYEQVAGLKLVTDIVGGKHTLAEFLKRWRNDTLDGVATWVPRYKAGPVHEESHRAGHVFVVAEATLTRFGERSLQSLLTRLKARAADEPNLEHLLRAGRRPLKVEEACDRACHRIREGYTVIVPKDVTKEEHAMLQAAQEASNALGALIRKATGRASGAKCRVLQLGVSECAAAWTDGSSFIAIERRFFGKCMKDGLGGAIQLLNTLVHELLHEGPSTGTHVHDEQFYAAFHGVVTSDAWCHFGSIVERMLRSHLHARRKAKLPVGSTLVRALDVLPLAAPAVDGKAPPASAVAEQAAA